METRDPDQPFDLPEGEASGPGEAAGPRGLIPEGVKKAILAGVGALFMTEEGARRLAREWKLPKDVVSFIGSQAQSAKDEILRALSGEVRRFLESEAMRKEFLKALSDHAIEIHAEIRFRPTAAGPAEPQVTGSVRRRRTRRKGSR